MCYVSLHKLIHGQECMYQDALYASLQDIHVVVTGYIRPEMRFPGGFPELLNRIKLDISIARTQLDDRGAQEAANILSKQ